MCKPLFRSRGSNLVACLVLSMTALLTVPGIAGDGNTNSILMPPNSKPHGLSMGEWSAKWWQWCYSLPIDRHPLFDTADCSAGQSGKVWFLGGTFTTITGENGDVLGIAHRSCTVPNGTFLFFPLLNVEGSTIEGNGTTENELKAYALSNGNHIVAESLFCTIDGVAAHHLINYRVQSPLFVFGPLPDNNPLQAFGYNAPQGTSSPAAGDGVYVMVNPLSKGKHTIHFGGTVVYTLADDGFDFVFDLDITYQITVSK